MEQTKQARAPQEPVVAILMATLNGARFLKEQLQSIAAQDYASWILIVSDDGSSDDTLDILKTFADQVPQRVEIRSGPRAGVVRNFLSLLEDPSIDADYFAFSDQDDIWRPDHLSRALGVLRLIPNSTPALYGGRTCVISEQGEFIGYSPLFVKQLSFSNAIVQSIAGANTMLLNRALRQVLAVADGATPVSHDWWAYQVATGIGGYVYYDPAATVLYRQHNNNVVGANLSWKSRVVRLRMLFSGQWSEWMTKNISALERIEHLLTPESRKVFSSVRAIKEGRLQDRFRHYLDARLYRQTLFGNIGLAVAVIVRKL